MFNEIGGGSVCGNSAPYALPQWLVSFSVREKSVTWECVPRWFMTRLLPIGGVVFDALSGVVVG